MEDPVVVFLDFDGVLRPAPDSALDANAGQAGKQEAFVWLPILAKLLEPHPEVKIIVSSDRRCGANDEELKTLLGPLGVRFFGVVENYDELSRAAEIRAEVTRRGLSRWLAIDDHSSIVVAAGGEPAFVACDPRLGLNCASVQSEIREKLLKITRRSIAGDAGAGQP